MTARRTRYAVHYGDKLARFSHYRDAMFFARDQSGGRAVEVSSADGLVGQFLDQKTTPEFQQHWLSCVATAPQQEPQP